MDGFRFDLAAALARQFHEVDRLSAFFDLVQQDPVVSQVEADRRAMGRRRGRLPGGELPAVMERVERVWETVLDTARPAERFEDGAAAKAGGLVQVRDRSLQVLRRG